VRVQDSGGYGGYVMLIGANDKQIQRSAGMCEFRVAISGEREGLARPAWPQLRRDAGASWGNSQLCTTCVC